MVGGRGGASPAASGRPTDGDQAKRGRDEVHPGQLGRVFVARLDDGESVYDVVHEIAGREAIKAGAVFAIGGMRKGRVVTGPENTTGKVIPHYEEFDDARELVGVGTVFLQEGKPALHFHAGIGRGDSALVGCPRAGCRSISCSRWSSSSWSAWRRSGRMMRGRG